MCHLCEKWLNNCNEVCQSPLLHHLNDAEHENVTLRNDVHVGKTAFECNHCGLINDLVVGFASVESNSVVVVLSRQTDEPCNRQWKKLTDGTSYLSYMVKVPGATSRKLQSENRVCVPHTAKISANGITDSSESQESEVNLSPIPSRFSSGAEYANCFGALIKLESDFQKNLVESMHVQVNITVNWITLPNGKVGASFLMEYDDAVWKLKLGDLLRLRRIGNGTNWKGVGRVIELLPYGKKNVVLEMETKVDINGDPTTGFSVTHIWLSTRYDRMVSALKKFALESLSSPNILHEQILGTFIENSINGLHEWNNFSLYAAPSLPPLGAQQEMVVKKAIQNRLTLIQGPSATGKTVALLSIVSNLVLQNKSPILVCAPTNTSVDHLALSINRMELDVTFKNSYQVTRLFAETRSSESTLTHSLSLEKKIRDKMPPEIKKLQRSYDEGKELLPKEKKTLLDWRKMAERKVLDEATVICCTCIAAGDKRLSSMKFHAILIDESMQATEPECMIPISLGCERLVLIGDHFQLKPVIKCKKALECGLSQSLFKHLVTIGVHPLHLTAQYRMHPKLWHFPSTQYEGSLSSGVSAAQRKLPEKVFPWPVPDFPLMFYDVRSSAQRSYPVRSHINKGEAEKVVEIVTHLLKRGVSADKIGIITQYVGQMKYLVLHMQTYGPLDRDTYRKIEVNVVDAFQGREKDIIIVSCVRSEGDTGFGSLNYFRYFHLILTRAKFGLIIVGNPLALQKNPMWKNLLIFCQKHDVLVEGKLDALKPSGVEFSQ